jgi:hypothetical protein
MAVSWSKRAGVTVTVLWPGGWKRWPGHIMVATVM